MIYFGFMELIKDLSTWEAPYAASALTLGNFDGVHLGHRTLIKRVRERGQDCNISSVVMTFDPHPLRFLFPQKNFKNLFTLGDRIEQISKLNPDYLVILKFDHSLSELSPSNFFSHILVNKLKVQQLMLGHDFSFGKNRSGSLQTLEDLCNSSNLQMEVIKPVMVDSTIVSSSEIRDCIEEGDVFRASGFLGRPFALSGTVTRGAERGRTIGFPTANLKATSEFFPKIGVYVTQTLVGTRSFRSVTNVGFNPTFVSSAEVPPVQIETHILNFEEDIYGQKIEVRFFDFIRAEIKFSSTEKLVSQIREDVEKAAEWK